MDHEKARYSPPIHHRFARNQDNSKAEAQREDASSNDVERQEIQRKRRIPPVPLIAMARNRPTDSAGTRRRSVSPWRAALLTLEEQDEADEAAHNWRMCQYLFWWCTLTTILVVAAFLWLGPMYIEYKMLDESITQRMKTGRGWFGANIRAEFGDMIQQRELDQRWMPSAEERNRRLIVVGDVHGCIDELHALLAHVSFDAAQDHLVFTGNLIFNGPDSAAIVDLAMRHNASCVRGDHEDRVLLLHRDLFSHPLAVAVDDAASSSDISDVLTDHRNPSALSSTLTKTNAFHEHHSSPHRALAASLSSDHIRYLYACPLILTTPHLSASPHQIAIVHAGLAPGVPLAQQDPSAMLTMRSVDLTSFVPSPQRAPATPLAASAGDARGGPWGARARARVPWRKLWDRWQARRPRDERLAVMYGHDAEAGVLRGTWTWGLDGGCWMGGELAAAVVGWKGVRVEKVRCRDWRPREMEQLGAG